MTKAPEQYARSSFVDSIEGGGWTFAGYCVEADFEVTPESMAPYAAAIFDGLTPFDIRGVLPVIRILDGRLELLDPEAALD